MFRPPRPVSIILNLAPMVDVMMCLIIFFLLASKIVDAEHRPVDLPYAVAARTIDRAELGAHLVINVRRNAQTGAAEYVVVGWDGKNLTEKLLTVDDLQPYMEAKLAGSDARPEDFRCVVRADRELGYRDIELVLRACGLAKIGHIVFSANTGEAPGVAP